MNKNEVMSRSRRRAEHFSVNKEATVAMQTFYQELAKTDSLTSEQRSRLLSPIPKNPFTEKESRQPIIDADPKRTAHEPLVLYKSPALQDVDLMRKVFPYMKIQMPEDKDTLQTTGFGWVKVEASLEGPNLNMTEDEVKEFFAENRLQGQDIFTYTILVDSMKRKGQKIDEDTPSRLLGAVQGEGVVNNSLPVFDVFGGIASGGFDPEFRSPEFGARSEQKKGR